MNRPQNVDEAYKSVVESVLAHGTRKENRTGVDTLSTFGLHYNLDLQDGFPLLTTKKISWKNIVVEMLWFLSGKTDISILKQHDCKFWDAWVDEEDKVPSAYGNFWRSFPVHGKTIDAFGVPQEMNDFNDQLAWVIAELKRNPTSRRMVVSAWAPGNAQTSKLPPCHCMFIFNVQFDPNGEKRLCLHLTQRSCDVALGVPYNIASYALLMHIVAHIAGMKVGVFSHTLIDAHIYTAKPDGSLADFDHVPGLVEQCGREPRMLPRLVIDPCIQSLADIEALMASDVSTDRILEVLKLEGYDPHPAIPFKVAV